MGQAMTNVKGLRGGAVYFNNLSAVTMYDFAASADSSNSRALIGNLYANPGSGGTPTRAALNYIGDQYMNNTNIIQYGCQRNAAFILTDGFADNSGPTPPTYDPTKWVGTKPYQTITATSLADIASYYYTTNLRPALPTGLLSVDPSDPSPQRGQEPQPAHEHLRGDAGYEGNHLRHRFRGRKQPVPDLLRTGPRPRRAAIRLRSTTCGTPRSTGAARCSWRTTPPS